MEQTLSTGQKALKINVDLKKFGTFAEIGAGQEVARWFFHVGRAAGTVAKSISAYDMAVSDSLYGATDRYVSRSRLEAMLTTEFAQLQDRHSDRASEHNALFVFADTVATQSLTRHKRGQGWMGIRFQNQPGEEASDIIIHAEMLDGETAQEQEAVGILGVNLIYAAFYCNRDPKLVINSLLDGLSRRSRHHARHVPAIHGGLQDRIEPAMTRRRGKGNAGRGRANDGARAGKRATSARHRAG